MDELNNNQQAIALELEDLSDTIKLELDEPVLTLDTSDVTAQPAKAAVVVEQEKFTEEEKEAIKNFSEKIDITNANLVLQYGSGAQKHIATFSETALENVRAKDMGEVGNMLSSLVVELKNFNEDDQKKGLLGLFKKGKSKVDKIKADYSTVEANVDKIVEALEDHQIALLKDISLYNKMYEMNENYYKELEMYIAAGKLKIEDVNTNVLPALREKAAQTGAMEDAQAVNDMVTMLERFEKRIHDLELTRTVSIQMGPQIRLLQNNDSLLVEKIHSSIVNTIPLWKSQMVLSLGIEHSRQAMQAQREVTDMTNKLLKENAELLKQGTIDVATESERGIVDIETLTETNKKLIETIDEVLKIQSEGKVKRQNAEVELNRIETELKTKLLEVSKGQN